MLAADRSVRLWRLTFDPDAPLQGASARAAGLSTWRDLLDEALSRGVQVSLALSDVDPLRMTDRHASAWRSARALRPLTGAPGSPGRGRLDVLIADHGARAGLLWRIAALGAARRRLATARRAIETASDPAGAMAERPGLAPWIGIENGATHRLGKPFWRSPPPLKTSVHNPSVAVFDDRVAIVGGGGAATPGAGAPEPRSSADAFKAALAVQVEGPSAAAGAAWFADTWNAEAARLGTPVRRLRIADAAPAEGTSDAVEPTRLAFTRSVARSPGFFGSGVAPGEQGLLAAHLDLIAGAKRLLYVETAFLGSREIAEALARRAADVSELGLILVVTTGSSAGTFDDRDDQFGQIAERRQVQTLARIDAAFSDRAALVSPVSASPPAPRGQGPGPSRDANGFVGCGVLIADDRVALIGSAPLSDRGLRWTTEVGAVIEDDGFAANLRRRLGRRLVPNAAADARPDAAVAAWRATADATPPFGPRRVRFRSAIPGRRFGARIALLSRFMPAELV